MSTIFPTEGDGLLNGLFKGVKPPLGHVVVLDSIETVTNACRKLGFEYGILSAPVRNVDQPDDASWVYKYMATGVIDFLGVVDWLVHHAPTKPDSLVALMDLKFEFNNTPISELASISRWSQFVPLDSEASFLDAMLLLGKWGVHRVFVVNSQTHDIENVITQSAIISFLDKHSSESAFATVASKTLGELGWTTGLGSNAVISVNSKATHWDAFKLMSDNLVSAVPVLDDHGVLIGNLSVKDVRTMLVDRAKFSLLNTPLAVSKEFSGRLHTCTIGDTLGSVIHKLASAHIHRLYLVDDHGHVKAVVSLTDVIAKFVKEPHDSQLYKYFQSS